MTNNKVILDASALLALLQQESGASVVEPLLKNAIMSTVNVAETLITLQKIDILPEEAIALITDIIPEIVIFDLVQAQMVAELHNKVLFKGLSLGDKACIVLGKKLKIPIYTADKIWSELKLQDVKINIIR